MTNKHHMDMKRKFVSFVLSMVTIDVLAYASVFYQTMVNWDQGPQDI